MSTPWHEHDIRIPYFILPLLFVLVKVPYLLLITFFVCVGLRIKDDYFN